MPISVCPAAIVAAPVEDVWELLAQPSRYKEWADFHTESIVPGGPTVEGQTIYGKSSAFGKRWDVTLHIEKVNPDKHQVLPIESADPQGGTSGGRIRSPASLSSSVAGSHFQVQFTVKLPLGIVDHVTITCTAIDAASCRVQYG